MNDVNDPGRQGLELIGKLTAALGQVRDPDVAVTVGLELLAERLGARTGVAWALDAAGQWRLVSSCGEPATVACLLVRHPAPWRAAEGDAQGPTVAGVQVWVCSEEGQTTAALRLEGLAHGWDGEELAPLTAAVGGVLGRAWDHLTQRQRYEQAQQVAGAGSWHWQAQADEVWLSEQMYRNLGTSPTSFEHTLAGYLARVHPEDRDLVVQQVETARRTGGSWHTRHRVVTEQGEVRWLEGHGHVECDEQGTPVRISGVGQDVTTRRDLEERLVARADRDELTGLANRHAFQQRLARSLEQGDQESGEHTVVALVDVDGFRSVNEHWGWEAGDRLLRRVADRLREVEGAELAARLSGDEFALLFRGSMQPEELERLAERIATHLHHPAAPEVEGRPFDMAVGLASTLHDGELGDQLLRAASVALEVAKSRSNARWQVFDPAKHEQALQRLAVEADLRRAVERGDIDVAYQPVLSLETGEVTGVEALARWQRPGHGPVSPATFIPLAERTGLMPRLGAHVLQAACRQLRDWDQAWPAVRRLRLGVNLSAVQLDDPGLLDTVDGALAGADLTADRLVLEVTETALSHDQPGALARLFELRRRGIRIAIDDFGTGYSSLARLREIPFDVLKIDRSFIKDIASRHEPTPILQALFSISRSLDLDVVAEGIETPAQLAVMLGHDCHFAQGFLFSRPLGASELETLLVDGPGWDPHTIAGQIPPPRTSPRLERLLVELTATSRSASPDVLGEILITLAELTGLDSVYLTSIDFRKNVQHILASHNRGPLQIDEGAQVPWTDTLCRRALAEGTPVIADVRREHPDALLAAELDIGTYVGVEVRGPKGGLRGTLCGATAAVTDIPPEATETLHWVARLLADTAHEAAARQPIGDARSHA